MFRALADLAHGRARLMFALTWVFIVLAAVFGGPVAGLIAENEGDDFADPGSQSVAADERFVAATGREPGTGLVLLVRPGAPVDAPEGARRVAAVAGAVAGEEGVARVVTYAETRNRSFVSRDGRSTYMPVVLAGDADEAGVYEALQERFEGRDDVLVGGAVAVNEQVGAQVGEDLARAELFAFPILFLVSLWVFRSLVAALLPLFVGILTVLGTFLAMRMVNSVEPLSIFALNLVTGLGLGLAIDYSLFMVSRYREELERVGPGREALRHTLATAGRTALFSSLTVAAALAALLVFPQRFLYSMGIGGVLCALVAGTVTLLALPAALALLGTRANAGALPAWRRAAQADARLESSGFWYRLSRSVMRRPALVALVTATVLVVAGLPAAGIKFIGVDATVLPTDLSGRQVSDAIGRDFPADTSTPVRVVVEAPREQAADVSTLAGRIDELPGAAGVAPPRAVSDDTWQLDVRAEGSALSDEAKELVRDVRALEAPFPVLVGGQTAADIDQQDALGDRLPLALALLAVTTVLLLFLLTGSVILPLKSLLMNLLTLVATFGLLKLIFQDGNLEGALGFTSQGALNSTQPILLFAVGFALSTDYGVFLLNRIKEARDDGMTNREAVAFGLQRTGRVVSAAAILFCIAIGAFATSAIVFIKLVGVGTALAVLIDATIVRAFLVPALMAMLGERNWWAPSPLRRLHARFGLSEAGA